MFLSHATFKLVTESIPIVTVDFICRDGKQRVLLGKRLNKPAQGFYFTPGGRIRKGERMPDAISRLSEEELGKKITMGELTLKGVYDQLYDNSIFEGVSSHFVNIAFEYNKICSDIGDTLPDKQHGDYRYFSLKEIHESTDVHPYVRDYFKPKE